MNKNRTAETITGVMSDYGYDTGPAGYDAEDRLVNWERSDGQQDQDWLLTAVGDWDQFTQETTTQSRTHNAVHELTAIDGQALTYDPKGNLTADHLGRSFQWDQDNMLQSCTVAATATVGQEGTHGYAYDAIGRRVSKTVDEGGGTFSTTVFSELTLPIPPLGTVGGQTLCEYAAGASSTQPERSYAFASYCDEPLFADDGTLKHFYHRDGRYSVVALTDAAGAAAERYGYDAYGERLVVDAAGAALAASAVGNGWGFTGRRHDSATRLQYFRARHYGADLGRFTARDEASKLLINISLYDYADQGVLSETDPSGLTSWTGTVNRVCARIKRRLGKKARPGFRATCPEKYRQEIFDEWYETDKELGDWWDANNHDLPSCPKVLAWAKGQDEWTNPDPAVWLQPTEISMFSVGGHPGGKYEMRSLPAKPHCSGSQCIYDQCGILITEAPGAGTSDLQSPDPFVLGTLITGGRSDVDVMPFWEAAKLDGCREGFNGFYRISKEERLSRKEHEELLREETPPMIPFGVIFSGLQLVMAATSAIDMQPKYVAWCVLEPSLGQEVVVDADVDRELTIYGHIMKAATVRRNRSPVLVATTEAPYPVTIMAALPAARSYQIQIHTASAVGMPPEKKKGKFKPRRTPLPPNDESNEVRYVPLGRLLVSTLTPKELEIEVSGLVRGPDGKKKNFSRRIKIPILFDFGCAQIPAV